MSCWARNGTSDMWRATSRGIEPLFKGEADPRLADAIDVFGGDLTCCRLGHPDAMPCDREALVRPMLGLFYEIYRDRRGPRRAAWAVVEPEVDRFFPKTFSWVYHMPDGRQITEEVPLFGDLVAATRAIIDFGEQGGLDQGRLPSLRSYTPGAPAARTSLPAKDSEREALASPGGLLRTLSTGTLSCREEDEKNDSVEDGSLSTSRWHNWDRSPAPSLNDFAFRRP